MKVMKKKWIKLGVCVAGAAVLLIAGFLILSSNNKAQQANAVKAAPLETKQTIEAFGIVKATEIRNVNIDFPAVVEKVHVKEERRVKKGDPILTLNIGEFEAQIAGKEAELASEQQYLAAKTDYNADPDTQKLYNDLKNAQVLYSKALKELDSKTKLLASGVISQYEYDEFKKSVDLKRKDVDDTVYSLNSSKYGKNLESGQKSASVQQLQSELKVLKEKLGKDYIKGNMIIANIQNGLVYDLGYYPGDIVNLSQPRKAFSIMDMDSVIVEANVSEEFVKDVKPGSSVTIIPVADKSREYKGKILSIANKAVKQNSETVLPVEISIDNRDDFLLPDFNVDVKIEIEQKNK